METSARTGTNIKSLFNELAKRLTGIETNPVNQSEIVNKGLTLHGGQVINNGEGGEKGDGKKGKKKKCC